MAISRAARQYLGVRAILPPDLQYAQRNPTSTDVAYVKGTLWLNLATPGAFMYSGTSGVWIALGSGASGGVVTINSNAPVAGNYVLAGTANQIAVAQTAGTTTFTIPAAFIAPGSIASVTTITAGTALVATTSVTAGTSITATAGDITATLGNVIINGAAKQLRCHGGAATDFIGTATLVNGTVTIANTNIAATDRIFVERSAVNASTALGVFKVVKSAGVNFVITACKPADATTETGDASTVEYFIVRQV